MIAMTFDGSRAESQEAPPVSGAPDSTAQAELPAPSAEPRRWLRRTWVRLIVLLVLFVLVDIVVGGVGQGLDDVPVVGLPVGIVLAGLVLLAYVKAIRFLERREPAELARDGAVAEVRRGTLIGLALFAVTIGIIAMFGGYGAGWGSIGAMLTTFGLMCAVAVAEELIFRGVLFRLVEEMAGTWGALVVSAVVFGALHLVNPDATIWGGLADVRCRLRRHPFPLAADRDAPGLELRRGRHLRRHGLRLARHGGPAQGRPVRLGRADRRELRPGGESRRHPDLRDPDRPVPADGGAPRPHPPPPAPFLRHTIRLTGHGLSRNGARPAGTGPPPGG
jgi:membrane protease YdiL (CAAX protease family)